MCNFGNSFMMKMNRHRATNPYKPSTLMLQAQLADQDEMTHLAASD